MMSSLPAQRADVGSLVFALNTCVEICTDAEKGYGAAAADVRDPDLKAFFLQRAQERSESVLALQEEIRKLGGFSENQGTALGTAHRGWTGLRLALEGRNDRFIVEEWVRGEEAALAGFNHAFRHAPLSELPLETRGLVLQLYGSIQASLDEARRRLTG